MNPQDATELGLKAGARSKRRHKNLWGRSAIAQRHWRAVSICSDEKRPLSDARREIERRAEGSLLLANVRAAKNGVAVIIEWTLLIIRGAGPIGRFRRCLDDASLIVYALVR